MSMQKEIKDSLDRINPEDGAKERMYQNIQKKADARKTEKNAPARILRTVLPIAACFCLVLVGAMRFLPHKAETDDAPEFVLGGNPYVEAENADAFSALGITMDAPQNAQNKSYAVIGGETAEVTFDAGEHRYTLRAAKGGEDPSGLNGEILSREPLGIGDAVLRTVKIEGVGDALSIVWSDDGVCFSLSNTDGASKEELLAVFEK